MSTGKIIIPQWILVVILLGITACNSNDDVSVIDEDNGILGLNMKVEENGELTNLPTGTSLGLFVMRSSSTILSANTRLTMDKEGVPQTDTQLFLPLSKAMSVCAYCPYRESWNVANLDNNLTFYISTNQSEKEAYYSSSLKIASTAYLDNGKATLVFRHAMAKINIRITDETGIYNLSNSTLTLPGRNVSVLANLTTGRVGIISGITADINTFMINNTTAEAIASAVVTPETVEAGSMMLTVSVNAQTFSYHISETQKWESGKEYMYEMKLTDRGLVFVKAQMTDWENGNDETELEIIS
ncbi:MAG: fimbrillin family protein [Bacteroides sp.]|uniref:fimbrillin family protein n=1 Tax=Bacteroides TaxID=816 RepID=UPI002431B8B8|nr:fimbrillin family protein [Bacteroides acidifaciens]MBE5692943.1 fimbrillin family protein [Bacteroides sp.]